MKATELFSAEMNPAIAYIIGLCLPLYKEKIIKDNLYVIGAVNHNANMITETEIAQHFMSVNNLISKYLGEDNDMLFYNQTPLYGTIQPKKGFSIIIEKDTDVKQLMLDRLEDIKENTVETRRAFVRGVFDGRSSFDTTAHYLSVDTDRDHQKQHLIAEIIKSLNIGVNLNQRDLNHPKNDQIRIQPYSLKKYLIDVGFYSVRRENIIKKYLETI
jgi:hypothetical protein